MAILLIVMGCLTGCAISVPPAIPSIDRTPSAPFATLDRPIGLSIPLYVDKQDYYLGYLQTTKIRAGDRLIVWDWQSESVKGTTFIDWSYRSLNRGMSAPVTPRTYEFWGLVSKPAAGLVFGSVNNSLTEVIRLDSKTGALGRTMVPGLVGALSRMSPEGKLLLADWHREGIVVSTSLRIFDLDTASVSDTAWFLGTDTEPETSMVRPSVFDGQRFWVVRDRYGDVVGDQVWCFNPSTNTLELAYTDDRPASYLSLLGSGPGIAVVALRRADTSSNGDLLVFDGTPGHVPTTVSVSLSANLEPVRGFFAQGVFYVVCRTSGVTLSPYSVAAVDLGDGTISSISLGFDLPSIRTLEVRGDQVFVFAEPDFEKVVGLRLDLTKGQTVGRYTLRFAEVHNP